jgi:hypothetical protein
MLFCACLMLPLAEGLTHREIRPGFGLAHPWTLNVKVSFRTGSVNSSARLRHEQLVLRSERFFQARRITLAFPPARFGPLISTLQSRLGVSKFPAQALRHEPNCGPHRVDRVHRSIVRWPALNAW